jgi:hypothetical protein
MAKNITIFTFIQASLFPVKKENGFFQRPPPRGAAEGNKNALSGL